MIQKGSKGYGRLRLSALACATALVALTAAPQTTRAAATVGWGGPDDSVEYPIGQTVQPFGNANAFGIVGDVFDIGLVLDSSGSMFNFESDGAGGFKSRQQFQQEAAKAFVNGVPSTNTNVAVVEFDNSASTLQPLTSLDTGLADVEDAIDDVDTVGGTNIASGIDEGVSAVNAGTSAGNSKQLVVVSDGDSNFGDSEQAAEDAANDGFVVHSVLLPGGSQTEMEDIADAGGGVFTDASDISTLVDLFTM